MFFVVGGVIALVLLGAAGFYDSSWSHNSAAIDKLNEIYSTFKDLATKTHRRATKSQQHRGRHGSRKNRSASGSTGREIIFKPIAPIPNSSEVTSEAFAAALRRTIDQLQHDADAANVLLPPKYGFSFEAQRSLVKFAPGSLDHCRCSLAK